ncbi:MAG: DUF2231 domain-containing protein [Ilumatobacteraceae bacterium]
MTELFGLPAHPFLVHAAVVLTPLIAVVTAIAMIRPVWRVRAGWWIVAAGVFAQICLLLAKSSGEAFQEAIDLPVERHATLAETTVVLGFLFVAATAAAVFLSRRRVRAVRRDGSGEDWASPASTSAAAVSVLMAVLLVVWVARTGHTGAEVVWDGVLPGS